MRRSPLPTASSDSAPTVLSSPPLPGSWTARVLASGCLSRDHAFVQLARPSSHPRPLCLLASTCTCTPCLPLPPLAASSTLLLSWSDPQAASARPPPLPPRLRKGPRRTHTHTFPRLSRAKGLDRGLEAANRLLQCINILALRLAVPLLRATPPPTPREPTIQEINRPNELDRA